MSVNMIRVINSQGIFKYGERYFLSYSKSTKFDIMQIYHSRYTLNKTVYNHAKVLGMDYLIMDIVQEALQIKLIDIPKTYQQKVIPDDRIIYYIHQLLLSAIPNPSHSRLTRLFDYLDTHTVPKLIFNTSIIQQCAWLNNGTKM